ncbi:hypothetical protein Y1Q_0002282 [Alligator mississippiensis]|uniref:Uncharacterized protein n=1 Tax=Alligator mississippiensis TaxID=8496 RepID=A0A151MGJ2_ALLMI|nr:hypothetical protein Y1Q_0002282 [Alligator mississippiensis]
MDKSCKDSALKLDVSRDIWEQKINLPQLEKPLEKSSATIQSISVVDKECPNCKKEKRIWNEYDQFILQSRKDKETLQKGIMELKTELKRYEEYKLCPGQENEFTCSQENGLVLETSGLGLGQHSEGNSPCMGSRRREMRVLPTEEVS